ncbi:ABC transporter ATP-binding protein [Planctomycetes bacterium K23_9]|uniref:Sulfate/thiosulfate import ATP-binding protein CysA n=1 Tax=Stieleria marina TaxID=1930275 RepID=A0A517NMT8_9BACT|nr:Sulfate/thiosulfate import ATP-binding protein CysA [Planctomycetes bacterium K23_9]
MIELQNIAIDAGDFSLRNLSFEVADGQYAMLMGRTGRGKTTILETICGLRKPSAGKILVDQVDVTDWSPGDRQIGYVPQDLALFPTFTVRGHIEFALRLRRWSAADIQERAAEMAEVLDITHLLDRSITGLSGGESQRVALGRALSFRPSVLLLDEPLSALDDATRNEMQELLRDVKTKTGVTTLHVTHSHEEADALADIRLTLDDGVLS